MESWGKKKINDLPDLPIPADQLQKTREKLETAKNILKKYKIPPQKLHIRKLQITKILNVN